jgi:hypothetical protein
MTSAAPPSTATTHRHRRPSPEPVSPSRPSGTGIGEDARRIRKLEEAGAPVRELIARVGAAGSTLLIDRLASNGGDERLVAHLPADEPAGNAVLIGALYAQSAPEERRCRAVTQHDASVSPLRDETSPADREQSYSLAIAGASFHLERLPSRMSIPELRWTVAVSHDAKRSTLSLRDAIAATENYEPLCSITRSAIARHTPDGAVSTTTLRSELTRVLESPIVLNRGLREAVLAHVRREGSSLSEIAIRCGRVKRDSRGGQSGETSWLARRVGILPEGGQSEPTVWVHSDVLALIARDGLGISPLEVELG